MDEGRLKAVKKGQKLHRKFAYAMNDTIRNRQELYKSCLSREEQEAQARLLSKVMSMRRTVVRNSLLLQCLNLHRKNQPERAQTEPLLGSYGGRPIDSFTRDIDQRLAWHHPRLRRLRKVDRIKQSCLKHGAILDEETIKDRMQDFFSKNLDTDSPDAEKTEEPGDVEHERKRVDDDDDDFDIRDYENAIGGAHIKLRLHPFGHMVDFSNDDNDSKKFNVLRTTSIFNRSKGEGRLKLGDLTKVDNKLVPQSSNGVHNSRVKSEPPLVNPQELSSLPPSTEDQPLRLSKYPEPLPPISSGNPQKTKSKVLSTRQSGEADIVESQTTDKQKPMSSAQTDMPATVSLRLSHGNKQEGHAVSGNSENTVDNSPKLTRRKTLILPPIESSKEIIIKKE